MNTMERLPNIHPGEVLREDYLIPLGRSAYWLAKGLRMSQTAVGEILAGKRAITPATALRLSRFFGSSAEFWLNLQASYDLEEERLRSGDLLRDVEPADLDEEWQLRVRELEHRRRDLHARLAEERERMTGELDAIEPAATAAA
jgi:addiction module HigA family antidote